MDWLQLLTLAQGTANLLLDAPLLNTLGMIQVSTLSHHIHLVIQANCTILCCFDGLATYPFFSQILIDFHELDVQVDFIFIIPMAKAPSISTSIDKAGYQCD